MELQKVLVTGAFGNLGSWTVRQLLKTPNVEITCFDRQSKNGLKMNKILAKEGKFKTVWGDIRDPEAVRDAVEGQTQILHLAALLVPKTEEDPNLANDINVNGLKNLINLAEQQNPVPRFIFTSSITVMGPSSPDLPPRKINDPLIATNEYSKSKIEGEGILRASKLPWVIFRVSLAPPFVANDYMLKYLFDINPSQKFEFLDPRDAGDALAKSINISDDKIVGKTMFLAGGERCRITQGEFLKRQFDVLGLSMLPHSAFFQPQTPEEWSYMAWIDTEESQYLLQYQNRTLDDFLKLSAKKMGIKRFITKLFRKQITKKFLQSSPYYKG